MLLTRSVRCTLDGIEEKNMFPQTEAIVGSRRAPVNTRVAPIPSVTGTSVAVPLSFTLRG